MLLAHGTTESNADIIESLGYFDIQTYFLKLHPDEKHAIYGVAGFAFREHPLQRSMSMPIASMTLLSAS